MTGSSRPWIDTARDLIKQSQQSEEPVWIDGAVRDILREHPDCGLRPPEIAETLRELVIDQRWSIDGG